MSNYNQGQKSDLFRAEDSKPHQPLLADISAGLVSPKGMENLFLKRQL